MREINVKTISDAVFRLCIDAAACLKNAKASITAAISIKVTMIVVSFRVPSTVAAVENIGNVTDTAKPPAMAMTEVKKSFKDAYIVYFEGNNIVIK